MMAGLILILRSVQELVVGTVITPGSYFLCDRAECTENSNGPSSTFFLATPIRMTTMHVRYNDLQNEISMHKNVLPSKVHG